MPAAGHDTKILDRIRTAVVEATPATAIYLFGSRATGNAKSHSDYDILVVTDDIRSPRQIRTDIRMRLRDLGVPLDILLFPSEEFEWRKRYVNTIPFIATREGLRIDG